ncbi:unnamed protein product, partial [Leptidea sinapis]
VCGFAQVVCGFLLLCDSRRILLSRLLVTPEDGLDEPPFYYVGLALLASGLTVCVLGSLGVWATCMPGYIILTLKALDEARDNKRSIRQICKDYGIPKTTILDKLSGRRPDGLKKPGPEPVLGIEGKRK